MTEFDYEIKLGVVNYDAIDPGVRKLVRWCNQTWTTTDSGDGESKPEDERTIEGPHVVIRVRIEDLIVESRRMLRYLKRFSKVPIEPGGQVAIEASYNPIDGVATILLSGIKDSDINWGDDGCPIVL